LRSAPAGRRGSEAIQLDSLGVNERTAAQDYRTYAFRRGWYL